MSNCTPLVSGDVIQASVSSIVKIVCIHLIPSKAKVIWNFASLFFHTNYKFIGGDLLIFPKATIQEASMHNTALILLWGGEHWSLWFWDFGQFFSWYFSHFINLELHYCGILLTCRIQVTLSSPPLFLKPFPDSDSFVNRLK